MWTTLRGGAKSHQRKGEDGDGEQSNVLFIDFYTQPSSAYTTSCCCPANSIKLCPLALAAGRNNTQCMFLLIRAGADVNEASGDDNTVPIMGAVKYLRANAVKLLLRNGCDISIKNRRGLNLISHLDLFLPEKQRLSNFNFNINAGQGATGGISRVSSIASDSSVGGDDGSSGGDGDIKNTENNVGDDDDDNLRMLRSSRRKILKLIRLSLEGWSEVRMASFQSLPVH